MILQALGYKKCFVGSFISKYFGMSALMDGSCWGFQLYPGQHSISALTALVPIDCDYVSQTLINNFSVRTEKGYCCYEKNTKQGWK